MTSHGPGMYPSGKYTIPLSRNDVEFGEEAGGGGGCKSEKLSKSEGIVFGAPMLLTRMKLGWFESLDDL